MLRYQIGVLCSLLQISHCVNDKFPPDFKFGAVTSSYQIEGGWDADGKGMSIWDKFVHENRDKISNNATGDVAADSYHLWREDVRIAAEIGLQFYRFSLSWPRILPTGFINNLNKVGAKYYSDLIDALLAEGIEPVVTIYHWELPSTIQDLGGWTNPLIVEWFGDFARLVFSLYGDRVKTWITINEPMLFCDYFYNIGVFVKEKQFAPFLCNRHVMLSHATAYRIYEREFRPKYPGRISLTNCIIWIEPSDPMHDELAELGREHLTGRYADPIFSKQGGWPASIEKLMLNNSLKQGYKKSRLPPFSKEEIQFMKGTADFFALNYYSTLVIRPARTGESGDWFMTGSPELNAILEHPPNAIYGAPKTLPINPEGIRRQMAWLKKRYGDIDILITETGYSTSGYQLEDYDRIDFIKKYLEQVLLSMKVDNVNVTGFGMWSLMDNFQWLDGYTIKYGFYEVNYEDPKLTRTPRMSAYYYGCLITNRTTGRYADPIFSKQGGWPASIEKLMLNNSLKQGYKKSRLPPFSKEEIQFMKGTADFFALNYYSTLVIRPARAGESGDWFMTGSPELNAILEHPPNAIYGAPKTLPINPEGIRRQMAWLKKRYGDIDILITETGYSTSGYQLKDYDRIDFIKKYLEQVLLSIKVDNVNVTGFGMWSLMDNFQWLDGYTIKYGFYEVNYEDPKLTRTPRMSAYYYGCLITNRTVHIQDSCFHSNRNDQLSIRPLNYSFLLLFYKLVF